MSTYGIILRPFEEDISVSHTDDICVNLIAEFDSYPSFPVLWNDGETISLTVRNDNETDINLRVDGLISDNSIVLLSGYIGMEILCSSAELEQFYNLHIPEEGSIVDITSASASLTLRIFMNGHQVADVSDDAHMTVAKTIRSSGSSLSISTNPLTLTAVVLAVVSDWSDRLMSDMADMRMQDMIYTEVG